ncbi:MAG: glycosyltransferase family 9 protein [Nanoarchaeota archaeon]
MTQLQKQIDFIIGTPLCLIIGIFTKLIRSQQPLQPKKILIIKLWAIGDSILMLPLVAALKKIYPNARIDCLCRHQNYKIIQTSHLFDNILIFEPQHMLSLLRKIRFYEICFDGEPYLRISAILAALFSSYRIGFNHDIRNLTYQSTSTHKLQHMVENYLDMGRELGHHIKSPTELVKLTIPKKDRNTAIHILKTKGIKPTDCIITLAPHVGNQGRTRLWNQQNWAMLADTLHNTYTAHILFLGTDTDTNYITQIQHLMKSPSTNLSGCTTLTQTIALLELSTLTVSLDAGIMHMAACQGKPTIGLFGPNTPQLWKPYGTQTRAIYHSIECSPCIQNKTGIIPDCLRTTDRYLCMKLITTKEIVNAAGELLEPNHHNTS